MKYVGLQVDMAIQDGAGKTKVETQDFRFKAQKTLFGYDATEKVEGWVCRIFEANGRMTAMEHLKVKMPPSQITIAYSSVTHTTVGMVSACVIAAVMPVVSPASA